VKRPDADPEGLPLLDRWRLVLGQASQDALGGGCSGGYMAYDAALSWLYDREADLASRGVRKTGERTAGTGPSSLTVPDWLDEIHKLFPKETIERLEQDAVERYGIDDVVTNPEVLERVEPNEALLRAVLRTKHLMNPEVLALARKLVAEVVRRLMEKLKKEVRNSFSGTLDRRRSSPLKIAKNFDLKRTIARNMKHYRPDDRRIYLERPFFFARTKRFTDKWQVIIVVDQSGSMLDSMIHASVTAACMWGLPGMKTHLCVFDTSVVDLTDHVTDPVEILMKVQLGGGTDIAKAVEYAASIVVAPRRTIVVLITDFYEGGDRGQLVQRVKSLCAQGVHFLGLAALDSKANPAYDRDVAGALARVGAHVGAMTPGELAAFVAEKVKS
jgi:Mg-chelatase subunit ChlD